MRFEATGTVNVDPPAQPQDATLELTLDGPNPFSHSTDVTLSTRQTRRVTVRVYDVLGREVDTLFDGLLMEGSRRTIAFEAGSMAVGLYFVRALSDEHQAILRLVHSP